ncbi:MAG: hypothetical protein IJI51_00655 [Lachnospiraceae bacterium]|nr:hypothetical protein [Lachnospiraceae bacterium]
MIGISGYGNSPLSGYIYGGYSFAPDGSGKAESADKAGAIKNPGESTRVAPGRKSSPAECQTCKERKYQDGSDENVSFKSAQHISPEAAAARVRGHEQEHVVNAYSKAAKDGGKVVNASVSIHTAVCPECGRTYVSGGTTHTMIKYNNEKNPYQQNKKANDALGLRGQSVDLAV